MAVNIFICETLDPSKAVVASRLTPVPVPLREFVYGETFAANLYLVDGSQAFASASGAAGSTVKVSIGIPGSDPAWQNSSWTAIANGWTGRISPNNAALAALFTNGRYVELFFEVEITDASAYKTKPACVPCRLLKRVTTTSGDTDPMEDTMNGEFAIPLGAEVVTVTGLALPAVPVRVICTVAKPDDGYNIWATPVESSYSTDGFIAHLNGVTDTTGYVLNYILIF